MIDTANMGERLPSIASSKTFYVSHTIAKSIYREERASLGAMHLSHLNGGG